MTPNSFFPFVLIFITLISLPNKSFSNDRLAITYASFDSNGFDNYKNVIDHYRAIGFERISLVPTYYHEHMNEIINRQTPSIDTIKACLMYAIRKGMKIIYKPHIDPVRYMPNYDIFSSDNASWRVNVTWRGFFEIDPIASGYYSVVILPVLRSLKEIFEQSGNENNLTQVRVEIGVELMDSMIRNGNKWIDVVHMAKEFIRLNKLTEFVKLSHNFTHHIQIEEDYILRMSNVEKKRLRKYIENLDEISISQYMDLTIFTSEEKISDDAFSDSIAKALIFYHHRFRELILGKYLGVKNFRKIPIHIGEFGIGAGGLKHPNYWEGKKVDKYEQTIGFWGLLKALEKFESLPNDENLNVTIWTIGPAYDIFGFFNAEGFNESVTRRISQFLQD